MLRPTSTNISIITNFGCRSKCWYCIWRGHPLEHVSVKTDWAKLEQFLWNNRDKGKVSVSGGGDCLHKYDRHFEWWGRLFSITEKLRILVDVHTREMFWNDTFWKERINRCVFSSDYPYTAEVEYLEYMSRLTKVRITHLVTGATTDATIDKYIELQKRLKCQFTIKELVGHSDCGAYRRIRDKYKSLYYLDSGDYNVYFMPDNSVATSFLQQTERGT